MSSDATKLSRQDQAAKWFAAERAGVMLVEQRAEFDAWKADPRNMAALDAMRELWDDLAVLKGSEPTPAKKPRSLFLPAAAAVAALLIGGIATASLMSAPADTPIVTAEGQQKTQSMPDGSVIAVNVASNVSYKFTETERLVTLSEGEAAFSVKPDPDKPFVVRVGGLEVRAVGTSFNVRQRDGVLQVSVSEGQVQLCRMTGSGESVIANLSAGQLLRLPASLPVAATPPSPVSIPPSQVSEWRMRVVTYEDATVREVIEDFNRYFDRKLLVAQPELLDRRVTIRLQVENREGAIDTLAALLDARVIRRKNADSLAN
ncbi:MAG: FecR domain-containing protein [Hyphomonadaceae bacterium]|nr:FecR domain-containing protein [Hyphomonadaceae bacterium]